MSEFNAIQVDSGIVHFDQCDISSLGANCVVVNGESQFMMSNSKVSKGKQYGLFFTSSSSGLLENNHVHSNGWDGIMLMGSASLISRSTHVYNNNYNGVAVSSSGRVSLEYCEIVSNTWDGIAISNTKATYVIHDNIIERNKGYGIYYAQKPSNTLNTISDNEIQGNGKGEISTL